MNIIGSRLPLIKFLGTVGIFNFAYTYYSKLSGQSVISIDDYLCLNVDENTQYSIMGIVKPKSIRITTGLNKKFIITDTINDLKCRFEGFTTTELKEGDTAVITAYCPDINSKDDLIVKEYASKHSMELNEWKTKSNAPKQNYGLQKYK